MKFSEQVIVALTLSLVGASVTALGTLLGIVSFKGAAALVASGYLGYLLWRSPSAVGRIVVSVGYLAMTCAGLLWLGLGWFLVTQLAAIWVVRSLYFHSGPLACLLDLVLVAIAAGAAIWAFGSGSLFLAVWSFFLVQGLFMWIPTASTDAGRSDSTRDFADAKSTAETALQSLLARN